MSRLAAPLAVALGSCAGLMLGSLACARKPAATQARPDTLQAEGLRASIARQVGQATCSSPAVCRTIPMGVKPCGGPRRYLVYSVETSDSVRLNGDVARFTAAEARTNKERGMVSDCSMVIEPQVSCTSGRCVAVRAGQSIPR